MARVTLTEARIRAISPAPGQEMFMWDQAVPGFGVRCYSKDRKVYLIQFRTGHGRGAQQRRMPLDDVRNLSLDAARNAAKKHFGAIALGRDPQAERKEKTRRKEAQLDHAIDAYEEHLGRRHVVNK